MVRIQRFLTALVIGAMGACATSPVRKQPFWVGNGDLNVSDGLFNSTPRVSPSLVRHAKEAESTFPENTTDGAIKISDSFVFRTSKVRMYSGSVAADGDVKISDGLADSMPKIPSSVVRSAEDAERIFSGSVNADGAVRMAGDLADSMPKVSPSVVRSAYHQVDADSLMEIYAVDVDELQSTAREGFKTQGINADHGEELRMFTAPKVSSSLQTRSVPLNFTVAQSVPRKDIFTSARFVPSSILHVCFISDLAFLVVFMLLIFLVSVSLVLIHIHMSRSDDSGETLVNTMHRFGRRIIGGRDEVGESSAGERNDWEGFLWKLNSNVAAEEQPSWTHWRMRYFLVKEDVSVEDESETVGVYVEFISEKGNMERVRSWATEKKPAILSVSEPLEMAIVDTSESQNILTRANQYEFAIGCVRRQLSTELPSKLYPLSITFQEADTNLIVASTSRQAIQEFARRIEQYSKPSEDGLFSSSTEDGLGSSSSSKRRA